MAYLSVEECPKCKKFTPHREHECELCLAEDTKKRLDLFMKKDVDERFKEMLFRIEKLEKR